MPVKSGLDWVAQDRRYYIWITINSISSSAQVNCYNSQVVTNVHCFFPNDFPGPSKALKTHGKPTGTNVLEL